MRKGVARRSERVIDSIDGMHPPGKMSSSDEVGPVLGPVEAAVVDGDGLESHEAIGSQALGAGGEERVVPAPVDGFDHLDRDQLVERARHVAVVEVEDADPVRKAGLGHSLGGDGVLGLGDGGGGHPAPVGGSGEDGEASPTGADLEDVVTLGEPELATEAVELSPLCFGERQSRFVEDGAGIGHGLVQHELEERVGQVVVGGDVGPVAGSVRATVATGHVGERPRPSADVVLGRDDRAGGSGQQPDHGGEVVGVPSSVGIGLGQPDGAPPQDGRVGGGVVHGHGGPRRTGAELVDAEAVDHHQGAVVERAGGKLEHPGRDAGRDDS